MIRIELSYDDECPACERLGLIVQRACPKLRLTSLRDPGMRGFRVGNDPLRPILLLRGSWGVLALTGMALPIAIGLTVGPRASLTLLRDIGSERLDSRNVDEVGEVGISGLMLPDVLRGLHDICRLAWQWRTPRRVAEVSEDDAPTLWLSQIASFEDGARRQGVEGAVRICQQIREVVSAEGYTERFPDPGEDPELRLLMSRLAKLSRASTLSASKD